MVLLRAELLSSRTASLNVSVMLPELATAVAPFAGLKVSVGAVVSKVQLNWVAAVFALLAASVKAPPATSIVVAPAAAGVNVAV